MSHTQNGWEVWYKQWDEIFPDREMDILPYDNLASWGEEFRHYVMLNDHWTGYLHPGPMSLEDGMSIAYTLYEVGVDVDHLLDVLSTFQPLEDNAMDVSIPLCWLAEPMDHIQDLLGMLADMASVGPEVFEEMRQMLTDVIGEEPVNADELPDLFRAMMTHTVQWLLDMMELMGEDGMMALRAWWQGRLITLLRETTPARRRERRRRGKTSHTEVPSAFRDLVQSLDFHDMDSDEAEEEEDLDEDEPSPFGPTSPPGRY